MKYDIIEKNNLRRTAMKKAVVFILLGQSNVFGQS